VLSKSADDDGVDAIRQVMLGSAATSGLGSGVRDRDGRQVVIVALLGGVLLSVVWAFRRRE
jgi:hypothetical protein